MSELSPPALDVWLSNSTRRDRIVRDAIERTQSPTAATMEYVCVLLASNIRGFLTFVADSPSESARNDMSPMDGIAIDFVRILGARARFMQVGDSVPHATVIADKLERSRKAAWASDADVDVYWKNDAEKFVHVLAIAVWRDFVEPALAHYMCPALPSGLFDSMGRAALSEAVTPTDCEDGVVLCADGKRVGAVSFEDAMDQLNCAVVDGTLIEKITTSIGATRTLPGQRLLRHLSRVGFRNKYIEPRLDPREYLVPGGIQALARRLDMSSGEQQRTLREALDGFQLTQIPTHGGGHESILSWSLRRNGAGGRGCTATVQIILMDVLMPGYVSSMPKGSASRNRARILVPFPELLPPFPRDSSIWACVGFAQLLVLKLFAENARQLLVAGGLSPTWSQVYDEAMIPRSQHAETFEVWQAGDGVRPPFIKSAKGGGWTLADAHADSLAMILQTGRRSKGAKLGGRKRKRKNK